MTAKRIAAISTSAAILGAGLVIGPSYLRTDPEPEPEPVVLITSGGIVWDANYTNFIDSVLSTQKFKEWSISNRIYLVSMDVPEPDTGACLLTYTVSHINCSGAGYISRKGIGVAERMKALDRQDKLLKQYRRTGTGTNPEIILLSKRNGELTVIGRLEPYAKNGKYDVNDNIKRISRYITSDEPFIDNNVGIRFLRTYVELKEDDDFVEIPVVNESGVSTNISVSVEMWKPDDNEEETYRYAYENTDFRIMSKDIPFRYNVATNSVKMKITRGKKGEVSSNKTFRLVTNNNQSLDVVIKDADG